MTRGMSEERLETVRLWSSRFVEGGGWIIPSGIGFRMDQTIVTDSEVLWMTTEIQRLRAENAELRDKWECIPYEKQCPKHARDPYSGGECEP